MRPTTPHTVIRSGFTGLAAAVCATLVAAGPAAAHHEPLPQGRDLRSHVVQPGDTATSLAVRYRAWTSEVIAHNHLGSDAALVVGQRIEVPVVRGADGDRDSGAAPAAAGAAGYGRAKVRETIAAVARRHGVDPQLALAVSWQESGWRMHHVSPAGAIGAMQVLPGTAEWMEWYAGRSLRPRHLRDNAVTGVTLLRVLATETGSRRQQLGAYYQGLGAVREHGLYGETRAYVASVLAIEQRLERGLPPA